MISQTRIILLIAIGVFGTQSAISEETVPTGLPPISMEFADSNDDGNLDEEEFTERLHTLFDLRDANKDGAITIDELPTVNKSAYQIADTENDGKLSRKEYKMLRRMDFKRLDENNDKVLYPHELLKW